MICFREEYLWVRDYDTEQRLSCRYFVSGRDSVDLAVGWHNVEFHAMLQAVLDDCFPIITKAWNEHFLLARYLCVPCP